MTGTDEARRIASKIAKLPELLASGALSSGTWMKNTDQRQLTSDYAPYEAFWEGFVDYRNGSHRNPYDAVPTQNVECRAWDRGQEAGMRAMRAIGSV